MGQSFEAAVAEVTGSGQIFEIGEQEVRGRPTPVFVNAPPSLKALLDTARLRGDEPFLVYEDETWTFATVMAHVDALGATLVERYGVTKGDRVAIAMRNFPEWVVAYAAVVSVGAVAVLVNAWWTADEMEYGLRHAGAAVVIADEARAALVAPMLADLDARTIVVRADGDALDALVQRDRIERYDDVVVPGTALPVVDIEPDDDVTILFTSGTTGRPKGAVSTHRAVVSACFGYAARALVDRARKRDADGDPSDGSASGSTGGSADGPSDARAGADELARLDPMAFILTVPLFHVTGCIPVMLSCFIGGYKLVMMHRWNPERALELIERERITTFVGVPTMTWDLLESPDFATRDTSSLVNISGGGAPAPPELVRRVDSSFSRGRPGIGYGMTETNAYGPQNGGDDYLTHPTSAGRVLPIMRMRVVDDGGVALPAGDVGEIELFGPNLIRGYWNDDAATDAAFDDGWLRTGDIGRLDDDGFIYIEDRKKDMILRGGENIYCAEVEAVLYEHPAVYEAAVFGIPHERLGEELVATVVVRAGMDVTVDDVQQHVGRKLAAFKVPSVVVLTEQPLPRSATGKILKRELRDGLAAG